MGRGIGERINDLQLFDDRAWPPVRDDQRQGIFVFRTNVNEMRHVWAQRGSRRQSRSRRYRHPQLPRWRLGLVEGESKYDDLEKRLAQSPVITVPTITLEGDANGAPHLEPSAYANKFTGKYEHRTITGGVGHNLPQEAPAAFAQAVVDIGAG